MELKLCFVVCTHAAIFLLIVPYGIETCLSTTGKKYTMKLLIVPYGIET